MSTLILAIVALGAIEIIGTLWNLTNNRVPRRTSTDMAISLAVWVGIVVWALAAVGGAV
jgi:hypothetical protein